MIRSSSGAVNRRTFVKDAALAAAAASGLTGGLGALSGLLAQPRPSASWSRRIVATGQSRPFTMLCLGDSVMWGQGLEESTKFTWLVKQWLEQNLPGRTVNRFVYARSGATIAPDPDAPESKVQPWMNDHNFNEVPCSWPWVQQQVPMARDDMVSRQISLDAVDLVLVDGGINDVGIVKTLIKATKTPDDVRSLSDKYCRHEMPEVLSRVRGAFPKAKILVTGYFPMISEESSLQALGVLLSILLSPAGAAVNQSIQTKLVALSDAWYAASNSDLGQAVDEFNTRWSGVSLSSKTMPAAFAKIPWGTEHSYAAPSMWLYLAGLPNDPVYNQRLNACAGAGVGNAGSPLCLDAKIGHPNPTGAAVYAQACKDKLQVYLPEWGGPKLMSACVEMDPMPAVGVATTLTVHATADGPAGRMTVPGTVHVGGQTFPTDKPMPVTLCTNRTVSSTVDREERKLAKQEQLGTAVNCTPLMVSAAGYVDVVIRDYLQAQPLP
jgi:lysophospholipase L1-like esterase